MRFVAGVCLCVLSAVAVGSQSADLSERILSTASGAFVSTDTLAADITKADVVFLNEQEGTGDLQRFELALLKALVGRRPDAIVALDVVKRAAQEPLEHFQMGHLSDQEFIAEAGLPASATAYLPLLRFAAARAWPIVATGPAETGGEDQIGASIVQAVTIGAAGSKRPLLISLHTANASGASDRTAERVRQQLPGRRVLVLRIIAVASPEHVTPPAVAPPNIDYVVYTRR